MDLVTLDAVAHAAKHGACPSSAMERIAARVATVCPRPANAFEVTAVLESLGYTDRVIADETGLADTLSLGRVLYDVLRATGVDPSRTAPGPDRLRDLQVLLQTFS